MKNLIVYLSPFEKACNIIDYSIEVAQRLRLDIHYIYNVDPETDDFPEKNEDGISKVEFEKEIVEKKKAEIREFVEKKDWQEKKITAVYSVFIGSFSDMFRTLSGRNHSELVLLPIDGARKNSRGKLICHVLDIMNLPVWCFHSGKEFRQIKTIVYGSDYKKEDIEVVKSLTLMAKEFGAKINILHVSKSEKFKQQLIDAGLKDLIDKKIEYPAIEIHSKKKNNVVNGIAGFCKTSFADLVVLMKKDKFFFQGMLRKSTIEKILGKVDLPIIIYRK